MHREQYADHDGYYTQDHGGHQNYSQQQAYGQEDVNDIEFICDDGQPLQIIRYDKTTGKFTLEPEAVNVLLEVKGNIGFCSLAGKYRTGKSFLLNQLLCLSGPGFRVNPTVNACTEGIWIWSKPVYNTNENLSIFFLDTEGLDSVEGNSDHDSKIFALAMLMSSYFMFNSVGCIDESSINQLSLVCHLVKNIAVATDSPSNMYDLSYFAPKFLWILRDFVLEVRDVRGNSVSPAQYLESSLCDVAHIRNLNEKSRNIREGIINFFRERDCITMVIPCTDEREIKRLESLPKTAIRPEFRAQVNKIREKIFTQCGPKRLNGAYVSSRMYVKMIEEYIRSINSGSVPIIQSAWQSVLENECILASENAKKIYDDAFKDLFRDSSKYFTKEALAKHLRELRDKSFTAFSTINTVKESDEDRFNEYLDNVVKHIERKEKAITDQNNTLAQGHDQAKFSALSRDLKAKLAKGAYGSNNIRELMNDYAKVLDGYERESYGPLRVKTLCDSLRTLQYSVFQSFADSVSTELTKEMSQQVKLKSSHEEKEKEYRYRLQNLDDRLKRFQEEERDLEGECIKVERLNRELDAHLQESHSKTLEIKYE